MAVLFRLKKNNLFGLNLTRKEIDREQRAIIVEGYMDMISLYQNGVRNVAASLGTALTPNQARLLLRYSKNIVLSYDSDPAGIKAALRGIDVISDAGGKPRVMTVTDGKDPDDFIKTHGRDEFIKLADNAMSATDYKLLLARSGFDLNNDRDVLEYIESIVPILSKLSPLEIDNYASRLESEFGISASVISMAVRTGGSKADGGSRTAERARNERNIRDNAARSRSTGYYDRIEMAFAILAMQDPRYIARFREDGIEIRGALSNKILLAEESLFEQDQGAIHGIDQKRLFEALDPDEEAEFRRQLNAIRPGADDEAFYEQMKAEYLRVKYRDEMAEINNRIAVADKMGDAGEIDRLLIRLKELDRLINNLTEEK